MNISTEPKGAATARFIADSRSLRFSPEVLDAAKKCLVDWCAAALGAHQEPAAQAVRRVARGWHGEGQAVMLLGGRTTPVAAALVNGTMAHCLDFDDTHVGSLAHLGGPTWAATLALAEEAGLTGSGALTAFAVGFEVGAKLGKEGFGQSLTPNGFHATGVIGKLAAAAAASAALGLDEERVAHALGLAATQAGGLTASFGTMAKPFHAGKAAMDGVLAAQLSGRGFEAATDLFDVGNGIVPTLVQDQSARLGPVSFGPGDELLCNTFKPYASCLLTHPAIDAARELSRSVEGREIERLRLAVHPFAQQLAGKPAPVTPLEAKFSLAYCVAIALRGYRASAADFSTERLDDEAVRELLPRLEVTEDAEMDKRAAALEVEFKDGGRLDAHVPVALGNPENPMDWNDMRDKFMLLVEPALGRDAEPLWRALRSIEEPGRLGEALTLLAGGGG